MLSTFFLFLKSKIFGLSGIIIIIPIMVILIIVIPNLSQISNKLGFDTVASVKEELIVSENNTATAIAANINTNNALKNSTYEKIISSAKINAAIANNKTVDKRTSNIIKEKNKNIIVINNQPLTDIGPVLKLAMQISGESLERIRISDINIKAIWTAYCNDNSNLECNRQLPLPKGRGLEKP